MFSYFVLYSMWLASENWNQKYKHTEYFLVTSKTGRSHAFVGHGMIGMILNAAINYWTCGASRVRKRHKGFVNSSVAGTFVRWPYVHKTTRSLVLSAFFWDVFPVHVQFVHSGWVIDISTRNPTSGLFSVPTSAGNGCRVKKSHS